MKFVCKCFSSSLRLIPQLLFTDLPVAEVALDETRDGHEQKHQDVDRREDLVDSGRLLDSERQDAFVGKKRTCDSVGCK